MTASPDWPALAREVAHRRAQLGRPQDLRPWGGPSELTVGKVERQQTRSIRERTKAQLDTALQWPDGTVDRILSGTVTDNELTAFVRRQSITETAQTVDGFEIKALAAEPPDTSNLIEEFGGVPGSDVLLAAADLLSELVRDTDRWTPVRARAVDALLALLVEERTNRGSDLHKPDSA